MPQFHPENVNVTLIFYLDTNKIRFPSFPKNPKKAFFIERWITKTVLKLIIVSASTSLSERCHILVNMKWKSLWKSLSVFRFHVSFGSRLAHQASFLILSRDNSFNFICFALSFKFILRVCLVFCFFFALFNQIGSICLSLILSRP